MMPGYFKALRTKIGLVTLAMACLLAMGWIRSFYVADFITFPNRGRSIEQFFSRPNWFGWQSIPIQSGAVPNSYYGWNRSVVDQYLINSSPFSGTNIYVVGKGAGFNFEYSNVENPHFILPYGAIVIPLTLLSAWLLLGRPK